VRYTFIRAHAHEFRVTRLCHVLQVSKAGYYAWVKRPCSARAQADAVLAATIRTVHQASRATYGSPRIHAELQARGHRVSAKRVARVMRDGQIVAKRRRRFCVTTQSQHAHPTAPNVLNRQFAVATVAAVNRVWATDITYIPTHEGWLYLAIVLDLASRRVVGWAMRSTLDHRLALEALQMALQHRQPTPGVLHHSDRGVQYACGEYRALLNGQGMTCSMSRTGNCWDNAVAESFFATLKTELVDGTQWPTRVIARAALFEYIEVWYNRQRRHSSLGYLSPADYEALWLGQAA